MSGTFTSQNDIQTKTQITSIEKDGFWLLTNDGEFFVSFVQYPAFQKAKVEQIFNFRENFGDFHWDELDIDIELNALKHPEQYPLKFE
jgi:hypothetical protein